MVWTVTCVSVNLVTLAPTARLILTNAYPLLVLMGEHVSTKSILIPVSVHLVILGTIANLMLMSVLQSTNLVLMEEPAATIKEVTLAFAKEDGQVDSVKRVISAVSVYVLSVLAVRCAVTNVLLGIL